MPRREIEKMYRRAIREARRMWKRGYSAEDCHRKAKESMRKAGMATSIRKTKRLRKRSFLLALAWVVQAMS